MSRYANKLKRNPNNFKLLKNNNFIDKDDINKIISLLEYENSHHIINEEINHISKRQIKLIRWIISSCDEDTIIKLKTGSYNISRLKRNFILKKKINKFIYELLFSDRYNFNIKVEHEVYKKNKMLYYKGLNDIKSYVKSKILETSDK